MKIFQNVHFFNGFLSGFVLMWIIPRKWFDLTAIYYYEIVEVDDLSPSQNLV